MNSGSPLLTLYSEPYQPMGNIDARAAKRVMGKPSLDRWTIFLRETLQNSWDARVIDHGPIEFRADAWWASTTQRRALRERIFTSTPPDLELDATLADEDLGLLMISDFGTVGLRGPTRADVATTESTDFVDFIRNIGRDETKGFRGGTYGFGKAVLYDASYCSTIVVYSRTHHGRRPVSRLMAVALGSPYSERSGKRHTGRHWWGVPDNETMIEPLTGSEADALAIQLGMVAIPAYKTGTSILVVAPMAYNEESLEEIVGRLAEAADWCAWPHMHGAVDNPSIEFAFTYDGEPVSRVPPADHPVLKHFVAGYRRATQALNSGDPPESGWPWTVQEVTAARPARRLGALAFRRYQPVNTEMESPFGDVSSTVALLRNQRFVVRYLDVLRDTQGLSTAGVFVADPMLDEAFARSEPVAHDDWVPGNLELEKFERNPVKQTLDRIRDVFRARPSVSDEDSDSGVFAGVAKFSTLLGGLLAGQSGTAITGDEVPLAPPGFGSASTPNRGFDSRVAGARPTRGKSAFVEFLSGPRLLLDETGGPVVEFDFEVRNRGGGLTRVQAEPRVMLDGNAVETPMDSPVGAPYPRLLGWFEMTDGRFEVGSDLVLTDEDGDRWSVRLSQPEDTAVTVYLHVAQVGP